MPDRRFILHAHSGQGPLHYDLMLEAGAALATWQFSANPADLPDPADPAAQGNARRLPAQNNARPLPARRIQDHRPAYLDYEGPVSNDRGRVDRIDGGTYVLIEQSPDRWALELHGDRLRGRWTLTHRPDASDLWDFRQG